MRFEESARLRALVVLLFALLVPSAAPAQPATEEKDEEASGFPSTGPLSGYMDLHFNKPRGEAGVLDFHRFVLLFNHAFSPRIRFVGELELEHASVEGLEEAGELELEQAYIDFLLNRRFNVRAGMVLVWRRSMRSSSAPTRVFARAGRRARSRTSATLR